MILINKRMCGETEKIVEGQQDVARPQKVNHSKLLGRLNAKKTGENGYLGGKSLPATDE